MKISHGRARPQGAPKTRSKTYGSALSPYLLLALFLASCAAPDIQHHIVISTRDQKLALLDRGTLLATYPVSTSKLVSAIVLAADLRRWDNCRLRKKSVTTRHRARYSKTDGGLAKLSWPTRLIATPS